MGDEIDAAEYVAQMAGTKGEKWPKAKRQLAEYLAYAGLGEWQTEFRFHPVRRWRADWCNVEAKVIVEYDGLTGATGFNRRGDESSVGHISVNGVMRDAEKSNEAQMLGYIVIRVNAATIKSGQAYTWIEEAVRQRMEQAA